MKKILNEWGTVILSGVVGIAVSISIAHCSSSNAGTSTTYKQIERLARPAINEGLVISNANLNAFNSIPPSVDLLPAAAPVIGEVTTVLEALYAGACFINGALASVGSSVALTPGTVACQATGLNILNSNHIGLTSAFSAKAATYVGVVAGYFLPDVMRIDTGKTSTYGALCGASTGPALCGGRTPLDPVADITLTFLLDGLEGATSTLAPSLASSIRNGTYQGYGSSTALSTPYAPTETGSPENIANCSVVGAGAGASCGQNYLAVAAGVQGHKASTTTGMPWSPAPW